MPKINKAEAFVLAARKVFDGSTAQVESINRILFNSINEDRLTGTYNTEIYINRAEKKLF